MSQEEEDRKEGEEEGVEDPLLRDQETLEEKDSIEETATGGGGRGGGEMPVEGEEDNTGCEQQEEDGENSVPDSSFWHIEASLDNGFETGMRVEIEHEPNKYWVALVVGCFGQLLSLKWEGSHEDMWLDIKNKRCFPLGHFRTNESFQFDPPQNISIDAVTIVEVTIKYFQKNQTEDRKPLSLFTLGGTSVIELFKIGTVVEVAHKFDPEKHWFAEILQNVGGRLELNWIYRKDKSDLMLPSFWLFFCHPRINHLGYANEQGNISYEPPVLFESWVSDIQKYLEFEEDDTVKLRKYLLSVAKRKKPELIEPASLSSVELFDKVLIFPSDILKLVPATVESKLGNNSLLIKGPKVSDITFCYPNDDNHAILPFSWADENEIPVDLGDNSSSDWSKYLEKVHSRAAPIVLKTNERIDEFKMNARVEVVHPQDPDKICEGVIIRVTPPLVWIQVSSESINVLPFNSTQLFPVGWCKSNNYPLAKLMTSTGSNKSKQCNEKEVQSQEEEAVVSNNIPSSLLPTGSKAWCPRIYFNHKCFTGPSLSKSKICELPRFVGPGPVILVMQEVISKIISVAYVPSRILNELSSKAFNDLLKKNKIRRTEYVAFKAKYQKRCYRDQIFVTRSAEQVEEFCRSVCSHLKCCYNLFGPKLYDGDNCPSNCRGLTKSNKVLKRATYYREKAAEAKPTQSQTQTQIQNNAESSNSSSNANDHNNGSNKSKITLIASLDADPVIAQKKKGVKKVAAETSSFEEDVPKEKKSKHDHTKSNSSSPTAPEIAPQVERELELPIEPKVLPVNGCKEKKEVKENMQQNKGQKIQNNSSKEWKAGENPLLWSVKDVYLFIKEGECSTFAGTLRDHEIDGAALLLLDYETIKSNLLTGYSRRISLQDVVKLSSLVQRLKSKWYRFVRISAKSSRDTSR